MMTCARSRSTSSPTHTTDARHARPHPSLTTPMRFIRSLLLLIYFVVFTVPYATACFIAFPFMRADKRYWMAAGWCRATLHTVR